jgi:hypothetical protein
MSKNLDLLKDVINGKVSKDQASYKANWMTSKVQSILEIDDETNQNENDQRINELISKKTDDSSPSKNKANRANMIKRATLL